MRTCLVCGDSAAHGGRPWCSTRCRLLLRDESRRRWPNETDHGGLALAVEWARATRAQAVLWDGPITAEVGRKLREIPERNLSKASAARQAK